MSGGDSTSSLLEVDVAIVGAGLAGLYLAHRMQKEDKSVVILEANHRLGGRLVNQPILKSDDDEAWLPDDVAFVEGGGQFVGGTHRRLLALLEELDLKTFETYDEGKFRWCQEILGPLRFGLSPHPTEPAGFEALREKVETLARTVPLEAPWDAPNATELDRQTFGAYLASIEPHKKNRLPYERLCRMHLGCDPHQVSLLYMLFLLHATFVDADHKGKNAADPSSPIGGYHLFVQHDENGVHQHRVHGGAFSLCTRLADLVGREKIRLGATVKGIAVEEDHVQILCSGGDNNDWTVGAAHVVVTVQPQLCSKIDFSPPLSEERRELQEQYLARNPGVAKAHFVYKSPFWRDVGYKGTGVTSSGVVFVDNSPPNAAFGVLLAFRDRTRADLTHAKLLGYAATLFGRPAASPLYIVEQDWSTEDWSASCISHTPPNVLSQYGSTLRAPVLGRLHWAGAETGIVWPSFMEGALESVERVLQELEE